MYVWKYVSLYDEELGVNIFHIMSQWTHFLKGFKSWFYHRRLCINFWFFLSIDLKPFCPKIKGAISYPFYKCSNETFGLQHEK